MGTKTFRIVSILLLLALLLGSSGCALFRNPLGSWNKSTSKLEEAQKNVVQNEQEILGQGKNYVYATKVALELDPSTNRFHQVETKLNDQASLVLGPPSMEDAVYLRSMVNNLLATNTSIVKKGEKQLADLNAIVIDLQAENAHLKTHVTQAEQKIQEVGSINAGFANKWNNLVRIFWWIVYGFLAIVVIKVLSVILPPPYNSIVGIIAVPFGLIIKAIKSFVPEAQKTAGVVAQGTYDQTKLALSHIIEAIEDSKAKNPAIAQELVPFLKDTTSKEVTRPLITEVKKEMGYV